MARIDPGTVPSSTNCMSARSRTEGTFAAIDSATARACRARHQHDRAVADRDVSRSTRLGIRRRAAIRAASHVRPAGRSEAAREAAHALGIAIVLDVVYNHFGPEGNYLHRYAKRLFHRSLSRRRGARRSISKAQPGRSVREFFIAERTVLAERISIRWLAPGCRACDSRRERYALRR